MSEVDTLWRDGVGPDDRDRLASLLAGADALPSELHLFAAWYDLQHNIRAELPAVPSDPAALVLYRCCELDRARLDQLAIDPAMEALAEALEHMAPGHPHAPSAHAWADLAIGDLSALAGDAPTARRRYEAVTEKRAPVALRLAAMLKLAGIALTRADVEPARKWARRALTLAETAHRYAHATRARLLLGLLEYAAGNTAAMRRTLMPHAEVSPLARILLASIEGANRAMPLLADGLRLATEQGDTLGYQLCVLVGARRYVAIGRDADALITLSVGIAQLGQIAPQLAAVLREERQAWQESWGAKRFGAAERDALTILESA